MKSHDLEKLTDIAFVDAFKQEQTEISDIDFIIDRLSKIDSLDIDYEELLALETPDGNIDFCQLYEIMERTLFSLYDGIISNAQDLSPTRLSRRYFPNLTSEATQDLVDNRNMDHDTLMELIEFSIELGFELPKLPTISMEYEY